MSTFVKESVRKEVLRHLTGDRRLQELGAAEQAELLADAITAAVETSHSLIYGEYLSRGRTEPPATPVGGAGSS
jgi:hypothetical protein